MPTLIDRCGVREDRWVVAPDEPAATGGRAHPSSEPSAAGGQGYASDLPQTAPAAGSDVPPFAPGAAVLVPAHAWLARRERWQRHDGPLGVLLAPHDDPAAIAADLPRLALIAVAFPSFTDGRGYSIARLLRDRHGWRGPLRAVGDIQRDQLFLLARCGFDSFALRDDQDAGEALAAFDDFTSVYQSATDGNADAVWWRPCMPARTAPARPARAVAPSKSSSPS